MDVDPSFHLTDPELLPNQDPDPKIIFKLNHQKGEHFRYKKSNSFLIDGIKYLFLTPFFLHFTKLKLQKLIVYRFFLDP